MHRHHSFGTADLVALMAAHRAATIEPGSPFDPALVLCLREALEAANPTDPEEDCTSPLERRPT